MKKAWTHKVVKSQRGSQGEWFRYPAAFTSADKCQCGQPATRVLLGLANLYLCDRCHAERKESTMEAHRPEPGYYLDGVPVTYRQWRNAGNA